MASGGGRKSATCKYSTKMEIFIQAIEEYELFILHLVIVPSSHKLPMIMGCPRDDRHGGGSSRSLDVSINTTTRHIDIREVLQERERVADRSTLTLLVICQQSPWRFMRSPLTRLPYKLVLWSMLLKGLETKAEWTEVWVTLLQLFQAEHIRDHNVLTEIQALLVFPPMTLLTKSLTLVLMDNASLWVPQVESMNFAMSGVSIYLGHRHFAFVIQGRVQKTIDVYVLCYLCLDVDEPQYWTRVQRKLPIWYRNWMREH